MNIFKALETSPDLEREGVQLTIASERITLARAGGANEEYNQAVEKLARERKATLKLMSMKENQVLTRELFAQTLVKNWETKAHSEDGETFVVGIANPDGNAPREFTPANVVAMFARLPDLLAECERVASEGINYRAAYVQGIVKN